MDGVGADTACQRGAVCGTIAAWMSWTDWRSADAASGPPSSIES